MWKRVREPEFIRRLFLNFIVYLAVFLFVRTVVRRGDDGSTFFGNNLHLLFFCLGMSVLLTISGQRNYPSGNSIADEEDAGELAGRGPAYYAGFFGFLVLFLLITFLPLLGVAWLLSLILESGPLFSKVSLPGIGALLLFLAAGFTLFSLISDRLRLRRYRRQRS
ncbi:MAG: hypothetical protein EOO11_13400 [Chitinophagaceae bacterium]|nr:MAG: hypothetical protein EOO11_13400 [Chitinophagaceae bacterium]